jgi:16S rRNA (cytosine967-C5)-methyltransferase
MIHKISRSKIEILCEKQMLHELNLHFIFAAYMQYIQNHIRTILGAYEGSLPLSHYLKAYFKKNPVLGSRDRKILTEMAYVFYRCAKGLPPDLSVEEQVHYALLLADSHLPVVKRLLPESLQELYGQDAGIGVLSGTGISFQTDQLFPYPVALSEGIERAQWLESLLKRPLLFIRVVERYMPEVTALLAKEGIPFEQPAPFCLSLPNGTSVEKMIPAKMYRIQDASSQQTGTYFSMGNEDSCWDCCCGAGGKSLLLKDRAPYARLLVSDVRASILDNLSERFRLYSYPAPEKIRLSAADPDETARLLGTRKFNFIIADVPCSGSGTWARTPEQLYFFDPESLGVFSERQKAITGNAIRFLNPGGTFIYITCSVFTAENEAVVNHLLESVTDIRLEHKTLINGSGKGADSMFVAVFSKAKR